MTPWQRRLRTGIAVFFVAFVAVVYFAMRQPAPVEKRGRGVRRVDPTAAAESTGGVIRQLKGSREDFRVEYDRSLAYGDGRQKLMDARIFVDQREGRNFRITADEAEVGDNQQQVHLAGDVELTSTDGLTVTAPEAHYNQTDGMLRAPGAVAFERQRLTGSSTGMTYEKERDLLRLLDRAVLTLAPDTPEDGPVDITSGTAAFARPDKYVRFERGFRLVHAGRVLDSDLATAFLSDDESRVEILEMRGRSRITGMGDQAGALRAMAAEDITLEFADDGRTLSGATLSKEASIEVAGTGPEGRRVSAAWIDVRLDADGSTVTSLTGRDGARLDLPADGENPPRTITAASLVSRGEPGKGLTSARFTGDAVYTELRPPAAPGGAPTPRVARARVLDLAVQPGFGSVDEATFTGAVRFDEGPTRAAAAAARYLVKTGVLELEGTDDTTGQLPRVADERVTVEGQHVSLTIEGRRISAKQDVRTVMRGGDAGAPGGATRDVKRPSMLKGDLPVYATAGSVDYDGASRAAVYDGGARLWQGDTAIQGDRVTLDEATGNLTAKGHARSAWMLEQQDEKTKQVERVPTISSADELVYEEAVRRATYTPNAHVSGPQGDLRAVTIEMFLKPSGNELERVEGYEKVTLRAEGRQATGDRLTYFADDGRYLMRGTPVKILAECRETVGQTLVFFRSTDTITMDGNDETRTQTKGGATCGEARAK